RWTTFWSARPRWPRAEGLASASPAPLAGGDPVPAPERGGEGVLVAVADRRSDLGQGRIGAGQRVLGPLHPDASQVAAGRLPGDLAEPGRERGPGHSGQVGHDRYGPVAGGGRMDLIEDAPKAGLGQRPVPARRGVTRPGPPG